MDKIITEILEILKNEKSLIEDEGQIQIYLYNVFANILGYIFTNSTNASKKINKQRAVQ